MKYILTIDAGTTSVRALLYDKEKEQIVRIEKEPFRQYFPKPAWVEHDAEEIWEKVKQCLIRVTNDVDAKEIIGIGITNQRETTVAWDKKTTKPLYNAIVWQCRRTSRYCEKLKKSPKIITIQNKTGLIPDAYFSATKMKWFIDNVKEVRKAIVENRLCFGTIESFLVYKLTNGKSFVTDITNASRTMIFNIQTCEWDEDLLKLFSIPPKALPRVVSNDEIVGTTNLLGEEIKIAGLIGDQQSSLFGQGCFDKGMAKNTYGTGCFMLVNTGKDRIKSRKGLLTTIAYKLKNKVHYALEGSVFNAGSVVDWAINNLGIAKNPEELTQLATDLKNNEGVYLVPAFTGLGTPYWDMDARGLICGMTRGTDKRHIARAVLESMAYSVYDVLKNASREGKLKIKELHIDGGASKNEFLMQFQANILRVTLKEFNHESTCLGAVFMTGLATGAYKNLDEIRKLFVERKRYIPGLSLIEIKPLLRGWKRAVKKSLKK